jgi:mono/diheme cytochrome c family protein
MAKEDKDASDVKNDTPEDKTDSNDTVQDNDTTSPDSTGGVTYTNSIKQIISENCGNCHGSGADIPLTTYKQVKATVDNGKLKNQLQKDPPHAGSEPSVSIPESVVTKILDWIKAGAPE